MTKRVVLCILAVIILAAVYCAGYSRGVVWRCEDAIAWSGDWAWYADTEKGPAYVLDTGMTYDADGRWTGYGKGYDGKIFLEIDGEWYDIPLYLR